MNEQNNFWFWLGVVANCCQLESYEMLLKQTNNDDLMKYLKHQDDDYLQMIIKQTEKIIELLKAKGEDENA